MKRWAIFLSIVLVLAIVGGAGYLGSRSVRGETVPTVQAPTVVEVTRGDVQQTVTAPGQLVGTRQVTLAMGVSGRLVQVHVLPGERVQAGGVLALLDTADLELLLAQAQAGLDAARANLAQVLAGPREEDVTAAQSALSQAVATAEETQVSLSAAAEQARLSWEQAANRLRDAQASYENVYWQNRTWARGELPDSMADAEAQAWRAVENAGAAMEQARLSYEQALQREQSANQSAQAQVASAQAGLERLNNGSSDVEIAIAQASVGQSQVAYDIARANLDKAILRAPFDGVILEVNAQPGETVAAGAGLVVLADPAAVEVETSVIEEDLPLVQAGQEAELFFDARPDVAVRGRVTRIVPQRLPGDRPLYPVHISAVDLPGDLLAGMTVDASIVVASRSDVLRLPRALVRARVDGTATVQVWTGSQVEERQVRTGLRGDVYVEIVEGLQQGDQVVAQ